MSIVCDCDVRFIDSEEWDEAIELIYRTFLEFDAPEFTEDGIAQFRDFISDHTLKRMYEAGVFQMIGAYDGMKLVGVLGLRANSHISLLFVHRDYHRQGIGRKLLMVLCDYALIKLHQEFITVNSSPYAVEFYHRMGFTDVMETQESDGIIYTPMKLILGV